jgi:sigma-E factor negative regulatory protein RseA
MSDKFKENTSALVDGELDRRSAAETIDALLDDDTLRAHWSRYHLVRDVLRRKASAEAGSELCERVSSVLADEPLHFGQPARHTGRWRAALKPAAGLALAASVAVVAVLAVRSMGPPGVEPERAAAPSTRVAASVPVLGERVTPVASGSPQVLQAQAPAAGLRRLQWTTSEPAVAQRLNGYLVNHSEYLDGAMKGMHPYARIVGYDSTGQR